MAQLSSGAGSTKSKSINIYTVLSVSLVLFFIGILGILVFFANKLSVHAKESVIITVLIKDDAKEKDIVKLKRKIESHSYTVQAEMISKEKAAEFMEEELGEDFISFLGYNPLLASLEVKLNPEFITLEKMELITEELKQESVVKEVSYQKFLVENIDKNIAKIGFVILVLTLFMYFVSVALIHSTIRLTIHSKRRIIRTMRLIGATNEFIRKPFVLSGIFQGLISSFIAIIMLGGVLFFIDRAFGKVITISDISFISIVLIGVVFIGVILSYISVLSATNRFLNSHRDDLFFK